MDLAIILIIIAPALLSGLIFFLGEPVDGRHE
jgi:hypothetical protein